MPDNDNDNDNDTTAAASTAPSASASPSRNLKPSAALNAPTQPDSPAYFDAMFAQSDDPWSFRSRWYERRKRALTMACLPRERFTHAFEPGCANGELSALLALRCDRLLATDGVDKAVSLAKIRLKHQANVDVRKAWVPDQWPLDKFDLIVLSEFLFYLSPVAVREIALKAQATLLPGGVILACHWRHQVEHCVINGDEVHSLLNQCINLPNQCHVVEPDLTIDVWQEGLGVGALEGLR